MLSKLKEMMGPPNPLLQIRKDLNFYYDDQQISSSHEISLRLRPFFSNQQTKKQFLQQLIDLNVQILESDKNYYLKLKILILSHIVISSQICRSDYSRMVLQRRIDINCKTKDKGELIYTKICQQYYCYLYKLAANSTLINEEYGKQQEDLMVYFTLANQCYIGASIRTIIETLSTFKTCPLIAQIVKFIYQDLSDIYLFILKDVKYFVSKYVTGQPTQQPGSENLIKQSKKDEIIQIYKECFILQERLMEFYKFNMNFPHHIQIMPPSSIMIKKPIEDESDKPTFTMKNTVSINEPHSTKNASKKQFEFVHKEPFSPKEKNQKKHIM